MPTQCTFSSANYFHLLICYTSPIPGFSVTNSGQNGTGIPGCQHLENDHVRRLLTPFRNQLKWNEDLKLVFPPGVRTPGYMYPYLCCVKYNKPLFCLIEETDRWWYKVGNLEEHNQRFHQQSNVGKMEKQLYIYFIKTINLKLAYFLEPQNWRYDVPMLWLSMYYPIGLLPGQPTVCRPAVQSACCPVGLLSSRPAVQSACCPVGLLSSRPAVQSACCPIGLLSYRPAVLSAYFPIGLLSYRPSVLPT